MPPCFAIPLFRGFCALKFSSKQGVLTVLVHECGRVLRTYVPFYSFVDFFRGVANKGERRPKVVNASVMIYLDDTPLTIVFKLKFNDEVETLNLIAYFMKCQCKCIKFKVGTAINLKPLTSARISTPKLS